MTSCNGICKRFLAQLRRVHNGSPDYSWNVNSKLHKPQREDVRRAGYDKTTYDLRVVKGYTATFNSNYEGYRRCAKCEIYIAYGFYFSSEKNDYTCPCCGNTRMRTKINSRATSSYGKPRY